MFLKNRFLNLISKLPYSVNKYCTTSDYKLVYSFPYIRICSIINKVKVQQSFVTVLAIPITAILEYQSFVSPGVTAASIVVGTALNVSLYGFGQLGTKFIGKVYFNEKDGTVKFAYLGFTGKRFEIEVEPESVSLSEESGYLYTKVILSDEDLSLKINEKYFDYCNLELARKVFGESFQRRN